jgi:RNA polymerase-binding transcription factor DksA
MALSANLQQIYRERLERERASVQAELDNLSTEIAVLGEGQNSQGSFRNHEADLATDVMEQERDLALIGTLQERQRDIERAFARLDAGTYGICERCGKEINPERLEALPFVTLCIEDQAIEDQQRRPTIQ